MLYCEHGYTEDHDDEEGGQAYVCIPEMTEAEWHEYMGAWAGMTEVEWTEAEVS